MQIASTLSFKSSALVGAVFLSVCYASGLLGRASVATVVEPAEPYRASHLQRSSAQVKTESVPGEFVGGLTDCDGDGVADDSRIDFDGDGVSDDCIESGEVIPEPPFQQRYTPTSTAFNQLIPAVGWDETYQCGDGLYEVSLTRTNANQLEYQSQGLTLTSDIVYDDLDPNLNRPLIIRDPASGIRYTFTQEAGGEFYEYAITNYGGDIGLYVYQTGEQIVAAPCSVASK